MISIKELRIFIIKRKKKHCFYRKAYRALIFSKKITLKDPLILGHNSCLRWYSTFVMVDVQGFYFWSNHNHYKRKKTKGKIELSVHINSYELLKAVGFEVNHCNRYKMINLALIPLPAQWNVIFCRQTQ